VIGGGLQTVRTAKELENMFFYELKRYNSTNFKTLLTADLSADDAKAHKSFSSVITRYFIFREKHKDDLSVSELNQLYFELKLDLISQYFAQYPEASTEILTGFQKELREFVDLVN
jgi:hypothetical protein